MHTPTRPGWLLLALLVGSGGASRALAQETPLAEERGAVPERMSPRETRPALQRAVTWLLDDQNEDGSWGKIGVESHGSAFAELETYYSWKLACSALAVRALLVVDENAERRASLDAGLEWLVSTRVPDRPGDWDVDHVWAGLYGFVACVDAAQDPRFQGEEWASRIEAQGRAYLALLESNQVPGGGWAYYDDPPFTQRPKWATSFCTALVLPALQTAGELGWQDDPSVLARGQEALRRCLLPNGAYTYSCDSAHRFGGGESIDAVPGSLGRIQAGNWGLAATGDPRITTERLVEGLDAFFDQHRFLDVGRMRPIPHEAYYAVAAYFYLFGHHYAAEAIELLPEDLREDYHARLRPHLVKTQRADGSLVDFLGTNKFTVAGTAFTVRALALGLPQR